LKARGGRQVRAQASAAITNVNAHMRRDVVKEVDVTRLLLSHTQTQLDFGNRQTIWPCLRTMRKLGGWIGAAVAVAVTANQPASQSARFQSVGFVWHPESRPLAHTHTPTQRACAHKLLCTPFTCWQHVIAFGGK